MNLWATLAILGVLGGLIIYFIRTGKKLAEGNQAEENVDAAERIAEKRADAPTSKSDFLNKLRGRKR